MTVGPKIPGAIIPPRVFTQPGSFSTEAANSAARPRSASPQKLTSDANEKLVAMGHQAMSPLRLRGDGKNPISRARDSAPGAAAFPSSWSIPPQDRAPDL